MGAVDPAPETVKPQQGGEGERPAQQLTSAKGNRPARIQAGPPLPADADVADEAPRHALPEGKSGEAGVEQGLPPLPAVDDFLYAIHYSQDIQENSRTQTPPVSAIIIERVASCDQRVFAAHRIAELRGLKSVDFLARLPELEKELLAQFFGFVAQNPQVVWLHWAMRKAQFGFDVLSQRARLYGLEPAEILPQQRFDLASHLKRRYGGDYAPHPRFENALGQNGLRGPDILDRDAAALAWNTGKYAMVVASLSGKVSGITNLFDRIRRGTFRTAPLRPGDPAVSSEGVLPRKDPGIPIATAAPNSATETLLKPRWDRDRRELWLGGELCKRYARPAVHQDKILAAFEEEGWPARVDDPLDAGKLAKTLETMRKTFAAAPIQFAGDSTGKGVLWKRRDLPG